MVINGARKTIKKLAQSERPLTPASANGLLTSNTKKTPVKTRGQLIPYDKNRFTIQISSKKELSDAKKVAVDLIEAGYDAYIQKALFKETNEIWYRIRIGSYQNKETAIAVAESLSRNRPEKAWVDYVRLER